MTQGRIMIVEDEVVVGMDLMRKLESLGYEVDQKVVRYGEHVIEAVERKMPDLILMDIHLKGEMSGTQAAAIVKEKYNLPIVFLTAYADEKTLASAKKSAPYAYLKKPVRLDDLERSLEIALYRSSIDRENIKLIKKLEKALAEVKTLRGLMPLCSNCKKIRDDEGYWDELEDYIEKHSEGRFSHGICPKCFDSLYGDEEWYFNPDDMDD